MNPSLAKIFIAATKDFFSPSTLKSVFGKRCFVSEEQTETGRNQAHQRQVERSSSAELVSNTLLPSQSASIIDVSVSRWQPHRVAKTCRSADEQVRVWGPQQPWRDKHVWCASTVHLPPCERCDCVDTGQWTLSIKQATACRRYSTQRNPEKDRHIGIEIGILLQLVGLWISPVSVVSIRHNANMSKRALDEGVRKNYTIRKERS